ncbi:BCCT, betaine/carnitine/choline family transporter [Anaerosphaera aminiphila DSM 21120]|uniref:BCCT, betaine/carnitine/choline family transporter n=1 Tax=Anaerosphaera aminiphila DSM 21120 TaxID=1120995 RepID=A0A1M5RME7_9FIRM|nr:BCCT family transporter [Anaerosphaera aminiphila]SHH27350.1 BCCT, betaine/carnitine/choline family transporter [Anaerosphaera aminiphila DSM 21120]
MDNNKRLDKKNIRWPVFIPAYAITLITAIYGIVDSKGLASVSNSFFNWSLDTFGWLYQLVVMASLIFSFALLLSSKGSIRIGGKDAKSKMPFWTWFAMALTGGVASGIVTWGVNEPLIYFGNAYGELDTLGIQAFSDEAARFAIGRSFYNWSFVPYAIYALTGVITAYVYFNKKQRLAVTSTLQPLFGDRITRGGLSHGIDTLSLLGNVLGLSSGLSACIIIITTGLNYTYGIDNGLMLFILVGAVTIFLYTFSSYVGLEKGLQKVAGLNAYFYYGLLAFLLVIGPTLFIFKNTTAGLAEWFQNFWGWGLDPNTIGGKPLVNSWTLFDWACWIAYAPVTGIFLGQISYGRTIREFLVVNLILPSIFGIVWFGVWGNSALFMQMTGQVDLVNTILNHNAVTALWQFLQNLPFGLGTIVIPINMLVVMISFVTAADATSNNVASLCVKDIPIGAEAPGKLKVLWGVTIGVIAIVLAAFGGTEQGVEGMKALAAAGGFFVLFVFLIQVVSAVKMFFIDKVVE